MVRAALFLMFIIAGSLRAEAKTLLVLASTSDLAAVAKEVGGSAVDIDVICKPDQDPHSFEILPRQILRAQQADVYLKVGVALDPWADDMIRSAENPRLIVVDCSRNIEILGFEHAHEEGEEHAHPEGNPHYWLAPTNLTAVAANIRDGLIQADSTRSDLWRKGFDTFTVRIDSAVILWRKIAAPCAGLGIVTTHASWDYFARDFGLRIAGVVSHIPDAEPSPVHLAELTQLIRSGGAQVFLKEPFTSDRLPKMLAQDTGIRVMIAPPSVGATESSTDIWTHFDGLIRDLTMHCSTPR